MINLIMFFILLMIILLIMLLINFILSKKMFKSREKMSPFECGFDSMSMNRMPFSLQFYLITIIFLIFDVEIALLLPLINSMSFMYYMINFNSIIILIILLLGLYMEIIEGAINWFKWNNSIWISNSMLNINLFLFLMMMCLIKSTILME